MIIPVAFKLTRADAGEELVVDPRSYALASPFAKVKAEIDLVDTATGRGHGLSGTLLADAAERDVYRAMGEQRIFYGLNDAHQDYLRRLRDEINRVLGED